LHLSEKKNRLLFHKQALLFALSFFSFLSAFQVHFVIFFEDSLSLQLLHQLHFNFFSPHHHHHHPLFKMHESSSTSSLISAPRSLRRSIAPSSANSSRRAHLGAGVSKLGDVGPRLDLWYV